MTRVLAYGGEEALAAAAALMAERDMVVPDEARPAYGALTATDRPPG